MGLNSFEMPWERFGENDQLFWQYIKEQIETEFVELCNVVNGGSALPDMWDIAYEDLCKLEGDGPAPV